MRRRGMPAVASEFGAMAMRGMRAITPPLPQWGLPKLCYRDGNSHLCDLEKQFAASAGMGKANSSPYQRRGRIVVHHWSSQ